MKTLLTLNPFKPFQTGDNLLPGRTVKRSHVHGLLTTVFFCILATKFRLPGMNYLFNGPSVHVLSIAWTTAIHKVNWMLSLTDSQWLFYTRNK